MDGKSVEYHKSGKVRLEGNYKAGERNGKWIEYFENGQIEWEINYVNAIEEGKWVTYWENGQIKPEGKYKEGKKDGTVRLSIITKMGRWKHAIPMKTFGSI